MVHCSEIAFGEGKKPLCGDAVDSEKHHICRHIEVCDIVEAIGTG